MSLKELKRLNVIEKVLSGEMTQQLAAEQLDLSDRQVRRLLSRVRRNGNGSIAHQLRGKISNRKFSDEFKEKIIRLYQEKYRGFGASLAQEKLEEEGLHLSAETLRKWLVEQGLHSRHRRGRRHLSWRERRSCAGEMWQVDGSHHAWFESRGSKCVLMALIDDATGQVDAGFYDHEGTRSIMDIFKKSIQKRGIPQSLYLDRHSAYKGKGFRGSLEEELEGNAIESQFERAARELEVDVIHAHSPQAKGRVERLFRTLQDRLVKEMYLESISTIVEGNRFLKSYLKKHNAKFSVPAKEQADVHRAVPRGLDLDAILCIKQERTVRNDRTVSYKGKWLQILNRTSAKKVTVEERLNGKLMVISKAESLKFKPIRISSTLRT